VALHSMYYQSQPPSPDPTCPSQVISIAAEDL